MLAALMKTDRTVLIPFGDGHKYDLAVDDNGRLVRIQCKAGRLINGCILFNTVTSRRDGSAVNYYDEADAFGVYCPGTNSVYLVPIKDVAGSEGRLRVAETKKKQAHDVRWADPYKI